MGWKVYIFENQKKGRQRYVANEGPEDRITKWNDFYSALYHH